MHSASTKPVAGEVWWAELGMVEKSRPVLILAYPQENDARALCIVAPLTSQLRGERGEIDLGLVAWLPKRSAVNIQGLSSLGRHALTRRLGRLPATQQEAVKQALRELLGL